MTNDFINQSQLAGAAAVACSDLLGHVIVFIMFRLKSITPSVQKSIYLLPCSFRQNTHGQAVDRNDDKHKNEYFDGSVISRWICRTNKSVKSKKRRDSHQKYDQICDKSNHDVVKWPNVQSSGTAAERDAEMKV